MVEIDRVLCSSLLWTLMVCRSNAAPPAQIKSDDVNSSTETSSDKFLYYAQMVEMETVEGTIQGDILVSDDVEGKKATKGWGALWPTGADGRVTVPYAFGFAPVNRARIRTAIEIWTSNTCIQFEEVSSDYEGYHLIFVNGFSCSSYVGRTDRDGQKVNLPSICLEKIMVAVHEIGHALGFYHEQARWDRNDYIRIVDYNIYTSSLHNFDRVNTNNARIPYDLASIMHYGSRAFTKNGNPTILSKNQRLMTLMGNREHFSFWDIKLANTIYKCINRWEKDCGSPDDFCLNDGYVGKTCECVCRDGTSGERCETVEMEYEEAMLQKLSPHTEEVRVPGLVSPPDYPATIGEEMGFVKILTAPANHKVKLVIQDFHMSGRSGSRCIEYLGIYASLDMVQQTTACGGELKPGREFYSKGETMVLEFLSIGDNKRGFLANVSHIPRDNTTLLAEVDNGGCQFLSTSTLGTYLFQNPNYPDKYGSFYSCFFEFSSVAPSYLKITALSIELGFFDFVNVLPNIFDFFRYSIRDKDQVLILPTSRVSIMFFSAIFTSGVFELQMEVIISDCHKLMELDVNSSGQLMLPATYEPDTICEWWLVAPENMKINLTMEEKFYIGSDNSQIICFGDSLLVNRRGDRRYSLFTNKQFCGSHNSQSVISTSNEMTILFHGGNGGTNSFTGNYAVVEST